MGVTSKLRCHKCGYKFERNYGIGVLGKGTLYCDRCGKPMNVDFSLGWAVDMDCECGGTYTAEALGWCPECGARLVEADVNDKILTYRSFCRIKSSEMPINKGPGMCQGA